MVLLALLAVTGAAGGRQTADGGIDESRQLAADTPPAITPQCDSSPLLIANVNVWTAGGMRERQDVRLSGGRVAAIAPSRRQSGYRGRSLDGAGDTLLPGLIDVHLHFVVPGGLPAGARPGEAADVAGRQLLRSGVTSGRVHLDSLDNARTLKARSDVDCEPLPRVQVGGPGLSGAAARDAPEFWSVKTAADAAAKVERIAAAGVDWVALHNADKWPEDVLQAIVTTARSGHVRLMGAGTTAEEIAAVLRARPDTLDYLAANAEADYSPQLLELLRQQSNLVLVPTFGIFHRVGAYVDRAGLVEDTANFEFLPPDHRSHVLQAATKALAERTRPRGLGAMPRKLAQLRALGLPLATGTDAGSALHFQAGAIWWELEAWRTFGASHRQALTAATADAARVLRGWDVGRLAVGQRADFVLYRGDVETGPFDASRVRAVGKGGVLYVVDGKWIGP